MGWMEPNQGISYETIFRTCLIIFEYDSHLPDFEMGHLKVLDLTGCKNLTKSPDFSKYTALERLILADCEALTEIDRSVGKLKRLKHLNVRGCDSLRGLLEELGSLDNLEEIFMGKLPDFSELHNLVDLKLFDASGDWALGLVLAKIGAYRLNGSFSFDALMNADGEPSDSIEWVQKMSKLVTLELSLRNFTNLPTDFHALTRLKVLELSCPHISSPPQFPFTLSRLILGHLVVEQNLLDLSHLKNLSYLRFYDYLIVDGFFRIGIKVLHSLNALMIDSCEIYDLCGCCLPENLRSISIYRCHLLRDQRVPLAGKLEDLSKLQKLEVLEVEDCDSLVDVEGEGGIRATQDLTDERQFAETPGELMESMSSKMMTINQRMKTFEKILDTINGSEICIPILSRGYALSKRCLCELMRMVELNKKIIPIFYNVTPADVKLQTDVYMNALREHSREIKNGKGPEQGIDAQEGSASEVQRWEGCLREVNAVFQLLDVEAHDVGYVGIHGIGDSDSGIREIKAMPQDKKILLVLDNADQRDQTEKLAGKSNWFGTGSRIIVTTRDIRVPATERAALREGVLKQSNEVKTFEMELDFVQSLQAFSICKDKLEVTYDELDYRAQQMFLDIACFLVNKNKTHAIYMWEASNFCPSIWLEDLISMSLVEIVDCNKLWMHDLVRDLGREIVRKENFVDPGGRSRLWIFEEAFGTLEGEEGSEKVEAMCLSDDEQLEGECFGCEAFECPKNLRFLEWWEQS
ncbi:hypothetical protein CRG98_042848 [Punica granatum]|uniref:Uncharacterized protein n=1 Tax=Punica granatum TaxID=22663 RepID=A0A2I0HYK6_PUNGR|nr:hypothetical protein CRG98_042848 [Punica granatum]